MKRKILSNAGNKIVVGLLSLMCVAQIPFISAMAGNSVLKDYTFDFNSSDWQTTREEWKDDTSASFMHCETSDEPWDAYTAWVWGSSTYDGIESEQSEPYSFSVGVTKHMTNWVRENDMDMAYIKARLSEGGDDGKGYFTGVWSPDSV